MPRQHTADFDYNTLHIGTTVEVSVDPTFRQRFFGRVLRHKDNGADILMQHPDGGELMLFDCWHHTDSRVAERPEVFDQQDKGVFGLSATEKALRKLTENIPVFKELADMPEKIDDLIRRLEQIEALFADDKPQRAKRKKPTAAEVVSELSQEPEPATAG